MWETMIKLNGKQMKTEQQHQDLLQTVNNSEQVQILRELVEQRRNKNRRT